MLSERFQQCLTDKQGDLNPLSFFGHYEREIDDARDRRWLLAAILQASADYLEVSEGGRARNRTVSRDLYA